MEGEWLIRWEHRGRSGEYNQRFLWRDGPVYVMDNHRAALWCWIQHLRDEERYALLHIDRHRDTLYSQMDAWLAALPDVPRLTLAEYLAASYVFAGERGPIFRYDNYLSIFFERYAAQVDDILFATHEEGDDPRRYGVELRECELWHVPANLNHWLDQSSQARWIVNLDIDYFFADADTDDEEDGGDAESGDESARERRVRLVSDAYIEAVARALAKQLATGRIAVLTIALSPEWCGGWAPAERACRLLLETMGRAMPEVVS